MASTRYRVWRLRPLPAGHEDWPSPVQEAAYGFLRAARATEHPWLAVVQGRAIEYDAPAVAAALARVPIYAHLYPTVADFFAALAADDHDAIVEVEGTAGEWHRLGSLPPAGPSPAGRGARLRARPEDREQYEQIVDLERREPGLTDTQIGQRLHLSARQVGYRRRVFEE